MLEMRRNIATAIGISESALPFVGELVEVKRLAGEAIVLADGRIIPASYRTFTHGYAVTSHAAQGKTTDEIIVVASSRSLPAVSQEQFYVSISRGRERCLVFTDDAELLRSHVTRSSARLAAVEVVPRSKRNLLQFALRFGHRFVKQFRQRLTKSLSPRHNVILQQGHEHEHRLGTRIKL